MVSGRRGEPEVRSDSSLRPTCMLIGVCCAWRYVGVIGSVRVRVTLASLLLPPSHVLLAPFEHRPNVVRFGWPTNQVRHPSLAHAILALPRVKSEETRGERG